jgi:hypothetical protein
MTMSYLRFWAALATSTAILTGCGGGDINISADNNSTVNDNSTTTTGGGSSNPCANYTDPDSNTTVQGSFDGTNCVYGADFVGENNPLTVDLTVPFITGAHIFNDVLVVGENVDSGAAPDAGPTLTIAAGATLAFADDNYVLVNRGSRIVADGGPNSPITFTSVTDVNGGNASNPFAVSQWGGVVINGKGITNQCSDAERAANDCHVLSEGKPSNYGGSDNADDSGVLRYVVIKHPGFEAAPGDELNGLTLNAVGSGTTLEFIEVFSTFDDGIEFFGGAAAVSNVVILGAQDDSLDFADGFVGSVTNALVIHRTDDGNRCIEGDNIGSGDFDTTPVSSPTISNLTCIISGFDAGTHGDSEGPLFRRGARFALTNSIVFDGYARGYVPAGAVAPGFPLAGTGNECIEFDDAETVVAADINAGGGQESSVSSTLIVCEEPTGSTNAFSNGDTIDEFIANAGGVYTDNGDQNRIITDSINANLSILNGFYTVDAFADDTGAAFTVTPTGGATFIGAVTEDDDWTEGWTFGLDLFVGSAATAYIPEPI